MSRTATGLCLASAIALAASVGAQQTSPSAPARNDGTTTTADTEQTAASRAGGSDAITLTGCLDRSPNGTYVLNRARVAALGAPTGSAPQGSASTTSSDRDGNSTTTPGGVASTTTPPSTAGSVSQGSATSTWTLRSSSDLAPHVGHQVQVTGRATAAATATGRSSAATPDTAPATGTSGASTGTASGTRGQRGRPGRPDRPATRARPARPPAARVRLVHRTSMSSRSA